jgi:multidrug efflux pump subunit AcrB
MVFRHKSDLVGVFANHRVACNLLMALMILSGIWALSRLNVQFFPNFALDLVTVRVPWTGAAAEDVETAIVDPLERDLRTVDGLNKLTSSAAESIATIVLEYEEGTDMGVALDSVKETVSLVRNLPATAEEPEITRLIRYDPVARLLVSGPSNRSELRGLVRLIERQLLDRGVAKIDLVGLPEEEIAVQVSTAALYEVGLSLADIAARIADLSQDIPAGTIGRDEISRQLRALGQQHREIEFENLPLLSDEDGRLVRLGDVATIERRARARQARVFHRGRPAVELRLKRAETGDSLEAARIIQEWLEETQGSWPPGVEVIVYDESWKLIRERIMLLLKNGIGGLVLVIGILLLFLNGRVAFWVAVGIPVSFMATLAVLYAVGGSINMISLFALIMALGIIVDDAIVVGEDALAHYQTGERPLEAAEGGARRMLAPVLSSSLTTIAAFLPLMVVGGIIGNILFDIPLVVVCVIVASLVESFLVLPGHLRHAFRRIHHGPPSRLRARLDAAFAGFRERIFRRMVTWCVSRPAVTLCAAATSMMLAIGLVAGGRVPFTFFPTPEAKLVTAAASFVAGTPPERVEAFLTHVSDALEQTERGLAERLVEVAVTHLAVIDQSDGRRSLPGDQLGSVVVELLDPDRRSVRNPAILKAWRERVRLPAGIESFTITERRGGPPGRDIDVRLVGDDPGQLKAAALKLQGALRTVPGVFGVQDDMPYGQEQLIYRLTPVGQALGLTVGTVGRQLRAAYDGHIAQIFQYGDDEIEVRVILPDEERYRLSSLDALNIVLPTGESVPFGTVVETVSRRGFDILRHTDAKLSLQVSGDVDGTIANSNAIAARLRDSVLPELEREFGVSYSFEGRQSDQRETLGDMAVGMVFALAMIYLVLAWVFSSYGWPLVVMSAIPFGIVGAIAGHWLLGLDLTILSLFGLFGLSGIVVNDSIILVMFYKHLVDEGMDTHSAIVEAACQRLRAVLLTSLTTIAGLTPLMFETSLQAQFLIPMATSISFGLAFATVLVLVVIPTLLRVHEIVATALARALGAPERAPATESAGEARSLLDTAAE